MKKLILLAAFAAMMEASAGLSWSGKALEPWRKGPHQMKDVTLTEEGLVGHATGSDGFFSGWVVPFAPSPAHELVFRAKSPAGGRGEVFWIAGKMKTQDQKHSVGFTWIGDGQWHEYRLKPFWHGEGEVRNIRIDFPNTAANAGECGIKDVRVEIAADMKSLPVAGKAGVAFTVDGTKHGTGRFMWASDEAAGRRRRTFSIPGDGRPHTISFDLTGEVAWRGNLAWWQFVDTRTDEPIAVKDFRLVDDVESLPVDLYVKSAWAAEAFPRAGQAIPLEFMVENLGGMPAKNVRLELGALPDGASGGTCAAREVENGEIATFSVDVRFSKPGDCEVPVRLLADGLPPRELKVPVKVLPSLGLPKAAYVPEPKPVKTEYDIGALYFPGWSTYERWERVRKVCPERKPVLGWYDETNPEIVDWQIKWLVEHGIRTLYVDWYWCAGAQHLDHWVKAFYRAKYRHLVKWAMMWANHNAPNSHSEEDQRAVTKFWIENYFNTPEYLTIDGMPVVWIWSAGNMDRDVKEQGGCRRLLEISREVARAAGYKGIWFIAMKWPEGDNSPAAVQKCKDWGFDMTGIYHFMEPFGGKRSRRFSFQSVVEANIAQWDELDKTGILPYLPNLSTGWDDRPWNDHCEIYGKNAADFRRICQAAKRFADRTGVKRLCLAPLNEWGEGSYAEPNAEHGFGFYDAVRDTFCEKPAEGWPLNCGPKDVGLGPYDIPPSPPQERITRWDCKDGEPKGWHRLMGLADGVRTADGVSYKSTTHDPAVMIGFVRLSAKDFREVVIRMRTRKAKGNVKIYWAASLSTIAEGASMSQHLAADEEWHDYRFRLADHKAWRGRPGVFRIDPCENSGAEIEFAEVRLVK